MSSAEEERKLKQTFLRAQIVNGGYEPEEFADYLSSKKDDGSNIDVWTYAELIAEVEEFKKLKEQQYNEGESMLSMADFFGPQGVAEVITTYAAKVEPEFRTEIGSHPKSQCYILKCEKVKTGMFSSAEEYTIQTLPFKYMVKRRYNDFLWLREKLVFDFPGFYVDCVLMQIPPVLSKGNQEAFLQNFLNSLMERTELKNSQVLQDFLANQDLKAIYKNVEPKKKSATSILDEFIGTMCPDENAFAKGMKHLVGQQAALEAVNRSEIDSFISGLDTYLEENIPLLSK